LSVPRPDDDELEPELLLADASVVTTCQTRPKLLMPSPFAVDTARSGATTDQSRS